METNMNKKKIHTLKKEKKKLQTKTINFSELLGTSVMPDQSYVFQKNFKMREFTEETEKKDKFSYISFLK